MASPPLEITKRFVDAYMEDDFDTAHGLLDADVELLTPSGRTIRGADTLRAAWEESEEYENLEYTIDSREVDEHDGFVRSTTCISWRWKGSGDLAYSSRSESDYRVRDGRIYRIEVRIEHKGAE